MTALFFRKTDGQLLLCPGHGHIKHSSFFLQIRVQHCLFVWGNPFCRIQYKHLFIFQPLAAVHGSQLHPVLYLLLAAAHLLHLFFVPVHIRKPFLISPAGPGALLQLSQDLKQLLVLHTPKLRIFPQIIVISDHMTDITDSRKRTHPLQHLQVILKLLDPVAYIALVLIISQHMLPGNDLIIQTLPVHITFGTVQDGQQVLPLPGTHGQPDIAEEIPGDPVLEEIGHLIPHPERNIEFHQFLQQNSRLCVGPVDHCRVGPDSSLLPIPLQLPQNIDTLLLLVRKFQHPHRTSLAAPGLDILGKPHLIAADDSARRFHDLPGGTEIVI